MAKAAANRDNSEYNAEEGIWTIPQVEEARVGDVQTSTTSQITHPSKKTPTIIPEEYHRITRASKRRKLLSAVDVSGSCPTARQAASRKYPLEFLTDFAGSVLDGVTGKLLEYRHLIERPEYKDDWGYSFGNEIGRLAQGMPGQNNGTDTLFFINKNEVPSD